METNENESKNAKIQINNLVNNEETQIESKIDNEIQDKIDDKMENNIQQSNSFIKSQASNEEQMEALKQNFKKNILFYFVVVLSCFIFTKYNRKEDTIFIQTIYFFKLIITFIICMMCGHTIHWVSHNINTLNYLNNCDNLLTRNKYINGIATFMCKIMDFHSVTHHDTSINKRFKNVLFEFLNNFLVQSVFIVWFIQNILEFKIVLLWGLLYATLHNINYLFIKPTIHRDHHMKPTTNYGIDITDILFNTKYDWNDIENYNHYSINVVIFTFLMIYFKL